MILRKSMGARNIIPCLRVALLTVLGVLLTGCARQDDLPPIVYMCPMLKDAAVLEDHAGKCPACGMELKPVRIVQAYSCLNNTAFIQATPGKCKTNGSDLVPITASMFWVCPGSPDKHELSPGKCSDGSDRIQRFEPRLHGDHNPRHGGQLFMAEDAWHHLEGTYPEPGLFRVFFYDDWTRPLPPEGFAARAIIKDSTGKELSTVPLMASKVAASNAMDAQITNASLPLFLSLRVRFKADEPEKLFDFSFLEHSKEPGQTSLPMRTPGPNGPTPPAPKPSVGPAVADVVPEPPAQSPVSLDQSIGTPLQQEPIPMNAREILAELTARSQELTRKIEEGAPLGEYWVPALRSKDLAVALVNDHLNQIPLNRRPVAEDAAARLLRAAYAIDNFGDIGDRERILSAHDTFVIAVNELRSAYASIR
jgi:hypothetical protein